MAAHKAKKRPEQVQIPHLHLAIAKFLPIQEHKQRPYTRNLLGPAFGHAPVRTLLKKPISMLTSCNNTAGRRAREAEEVDNVTSVRHLTSSTLLAILLNRVQATLSEVQCSKLL